MSMCKVMRVRALMLTLFTWLFDGQLKLQSEIEMRKSIVLAEVLVVRLGQEDAKATASAIGSISE